jgi:GNAT superfamily N-acetyltransferase
MNRSMSETSDYIAEHKLPAFTVTEMTNTDEGFYSLVGPWLSRREIVDELGGPVWDDDDKFWIIAHNDEGLLGMVAVRGKTVCSLYVAPGHRGQLAGTTLVLRLVLRRGSENLRAVATDASLGLFKECGFKERRRKGRYHLLERVP